MFRDEHDATSQPIQSITREGVESQPSFCAHDLDDGIVIIPACGMDGHAGGFVDDDQVFRLVDDPDRLGCDGRFVTVQSVRDDVSVFDQGFYRSDWFAVDDDRARLDRFRVVFYSPVAELVDEDVENLPAPPPLFAPGVVCVVVWLDAAVAVFKIVRSGPGVAWCDGDFWRWRDCFETVFECFVGHVSRVEKETWLIRVRFRRRGGHDTVYSMLKSTTDQIGPTSNSQSRLHRSDTIL